MPNTREWAMVAWVSAGFALTLLSGDLRSSLSGVAKSVWHWKVLVPILLMAAWVAISIAAATRFALWTSDLLFDTCLWFLTAGIVLLVGSVTDASSQLHFFRKQAIATVSFTALIQGYVLLFTFPLWIELLLQPVLFVVGILAAFTNLKEEYRPARPVLNGTLAALGLTLVGFVTYSLISDWRAANKPDLLRSVLLPIWLSAVTLPFNYVLALLAAYGRAFVQLRWAKGWIDQPYRHGRMAMLIGFNVHVYGLVKFVSPWPQRLLEKNALPDAVSVVRRFRQEQRASRL